MSDNPFEASGRAPSDGAEADLIIRPSTELGSVFREAGRLWVAALPLLLLTVIITAIPASLLSTWLNYSELDFQLQLRVQQISDGLLSMIQVGALGTILHRAAMDAPNSVGKAFVGGLALFIPLVILNIPVGIAVGCGFVLLVIPGVYLGTRLCLTHVSYMLEPGDGLGSALSRSWQLTSGQRFWPTFLVGLCSLLAVVVVAALYFVVALVWGVVLELVYELQLPVDQTLIIVADYGVMLIIDLLFAYPWLFVWFPFFVYLRGLVALEQDGLMA